MRPKVVKSSLYNKSREEEKPKTPTQHFVEVNTHKNIVLKRQFLSLDDLKTAILKKNGKYNLDKGLSLIFINHVL